MPKAAHGSENIGRQTASSKLIVEAAMRLFDRIVNENLLVRRIGFTTAHLIQEREAKNELVAEQLDLFTDFEALDAQRAEENAELEREKKLQKAVVQLKQKYGKNAVLKGTNLMEGATTIERNKQIGGHKA